MSTMKFSIMFYVLCMLLAPALKPVNAHHLTFSHQTRSQIRSSIPMKTCYDDVLPIQDVTSSLSTDMVPLMLSKVKLDTARNTAQHLACNSSSRQETQQKYPWPYTWRKLALKLHSIKQWPDVEAFCNGSTITGLSVAMSRTAGLGHFGHRMLSELPALYALKLYLTSVGIDVSHVRVIYTDALGHPAWGPDNFKPILYSLGYHSYEPSDTTTICFDQVIFMPVMFYPKWYTTTQGKRINMWQAPDKLYDADPFHLSLIGHIRKYAFGLTESLPFAPTSNRTIVLASRDASTRKRLGFRQSRLLLNEDKLHEALKKLNNINVVRVEMGAENIADIVRMLEGASLFLGYHGAAFDNLVFLPRGAFVLEILPMGTDHAPLYPSLAHRTGKEFARYVNEDPKRQASHNHYANLTVDVTAVMKLVESILQTQLATLRRYKFDAWVR